MDQRHQVSVRMKQSSLNALDRLCAANARSRRDIVEILVDGAAKELRKDKSARVNP